MPAGPHDTVIDKNDKNIQLLCYECQSHAGEWISLEYCLSFCDNCGIKLQNKNYIIELFHITELSTKERQKLFTGGNQRFQQFLNCLSLLHGKGSPRNSSDLYTSPSVLYYRDVLHDEYNQLPPRPYVDEYYEELSRKYSHSPFQSRYHHLSLRDSIGVIKDRIQDSEVASFKYLRHKAAKPYKILLKKYQQDSPCSCSS